MKKFIIKIKSLVSKEKLNKIKDLFFKKDVIIDLAIFVFFLLFACITDFNVINGSSMYPTIKENDFSISSVLKAKFKNIKRFDIVVIDVNEEKFIIKRVIGLPNETIEYINNKLYINGEYINEDYFDDEYVIENNIRTSDFKITLSENEYFCLGDNRNISLDSRYYGPFSIDDIVSVGCFVLFPFSDFGGK